MSFVGYTDFDQKSNGMFDILDFTEDEMKFKTFLKNVRARGGADGPEDMVGGLEKAV